MRRSRRAGRWRHNTPQTFQNEKYSVDTDWDYDDIDGDGLSDLTVVQESKINDKVFQRSTNEFFGVGPEGRDAILDCFEKRGLDDDDHLETNRFRDVLLKMRDGIFALRDINRYFRKWLTKQARDLRQNRIQVEDFDDNPDDDD